MGAKTVGLACADPGVMTPIIIGGIISILDKFTICDTVLLKLKSITQEIKGCNYLCTMRVTQKYTD
jgi:hypothetical protein